MMEIKKLTEKEAKTLLSNRDMLDRQVTEEEYAEAVRYLISSIGRIVEYHRSRNPDRIIDGIRVFGEGSAIAGIDEVLKQELGAQVTHFSTLQGIKAGSKSYLTSETALRYLANFGAVLNPIGLNLSRGKSKESVSKTADKILTAILVLAILVMVGISVFTLVKYYLTDAAKQALQGEIAKIEDVEQIAADYENAQIAYDTMKTFDDSTKSNNELVLQFINDLEKIMPTDTIVNSFTATNGMVTFSVMAPSKEAIADTIVEMRKLEYVKSFSIPAYSEVMGAIPGTEAETLYIEAVESGDYVEGSFTYVTYSFSCVLDEPVVEVVEEGGAQ